jgi:hypothetical protein
MEFYVFMNREGEILCKNGSLNIYKSKTEFDRMITYRREATAKNMTKDIPYWRCRNIDIDEFKVVKVKISCERVG